MYDKLSIPIDVAMKITAAIESNAAIRAIILDAQNANPINPETPFDPNELGYSTQIKDASAEAYSIACSIYPSISLRDFHKIFLDFRLRLLNEKL